MHEKINYWKYFGLNKQDVMEYADTVSIENILFLRPQCLFIWIATYLCGLGFLFQPGLFRKSIVLFACGSFFMILYFLIRDAIRSIETIRVKRASILVRAFAIVLFGITCYIGTFAANGQLAVTVVAVLLFIQVDVDVLPVKNLRYALMGFGIFMLCSYLTKDQYHFLLDVLDATMSTTLGLFVSWQKAKNKWEYVIAQGKLREINYELYHASVTDELTKLPNRRQAFDRFRKLSERCIENDATLACIIMDIDQFKQFNDTYGHPQGDKLLETVGKLLLHFACRTGVQVGRIGGEEFMFFWEETDPEHIFTVAESIRTAIQSIPHPDRDKGAVVTASLGICGCEPKSGFDIEEVYREADNAMYCAKRSGKNGCWCYCPGTGQYAPIQSMGVDS